MNPYVALVIVIGMPIVFVALLVWLVCSFDKLTLSDVAISALVAFVWPVMVPLLLVQSIPDLTIWRRK